MEQTLMLFGKKEDEWTRYWASISSETVDAKGRGTGEYVRASITVRLSARAAEAFDLYAKPTKKNKRITAVLADTEGWLKAAVNRDGEGYPVLFVNKLKLHEEDD